MSEFLKLFDAYAAARIELRAMSEDDSAFSGWLDHCTSLWTSLCEARANLKTQSRKRVKS